MIEILNKDIFEISKLIQNNTLTPVDIYNQFSNQIHKYENQISSFVEIYSDWEEKARIAEKQILNGEYKGPLHGIPIAVKDLVNINGRVTTAGSKIMENNFSNEDADVITALESSGAIIVGKTQMVEFAFGPHGINSNSDQTKNPWNLNFIPGGSSSGSAAAVASNFSPIAIGSDTGGSIRMPASFCGVTGFKPSYNKLSTNGVFPLSWTLDTIGPIAKSTRDCAIFVQEVCKYQKNRDLDPFKGFHVDMIDNFDAMLPVRLKIGVPTGNYFENIDPEINEVYQKSIKLMRDNGAEIIEIDLEWLSLCRPVNVIITMAEAIKIHSKFLKNNYSDYTYEVVSRLVAGEALSVQDYLGSLRVMNYFQEKIDEIYNDVNIIACPTNPVLPDEIENYSKENMSNSSKVIGARIPAFTSIFNVTRQPSLSTRAGFSNTGLPIGIMFTGKFDQDFGVLQVGNWFEKLNYDVNSKMPLIN